MSKKKIVIVEDEPDILEILEYNLAREGYEVICADNGIDGLKLIIEHQPNIAILDLMLPGMDGLEICQQVRLNNKVAHTPIIMLTAKNEESDIVLGLGVGADDYMSKPFSPRELIARIKAMLRRDQANHQLNQQLSQQPLQQNGLEGSCISINGLVIDSIKYKVTFNGNKIKLTATEFRLLEYLAQSPGQVFSREQIMNNAYGSDVVVVDRNIDVHIRSIRKKIGEENQFIETIRGIGYSFTDTIN